MSDRAETVFATPVEIEPQAFAGRARHQGVETGRRLQIAVLIERTRSQTRQSATTRPPFTAPPSSMAMDVVPPDRLPQRDQRSASMRLIGARQETLSAEAHFRPFIEVLTESILAPVGAHCQALITDDVLPAALCERMALIITELVMNAAKHAFRGRTGGTVQVAIREENGAWLCSVSDDGVGVMYRTRGLGSQIVDELVRTLGGIIIMRSGRWGTQVLVSFPADPAPQWPGSFSRAKQSIAAIPYKKFEQLSRNLNCEGVNSQRVELRQASTE